MGKYSGSAAAWGWTAWEAGAGLAAAEALAVWWRFEEGHSVKIVEVYRCGSS